MKIINNDIETLTDNIKLFPRSSTEDVVGRENAEQAKLADRDHGHLQQKKIIGAYNGHQPGLLDRIQEI
ncbi:hypothetical protein DPMN_027281 [Dreissena polymorpha]|uniref:Uncharacterized protein n=1 Tax=Dreissena polymorpha TaxID=45954 RepID=A0A9D4LU25_DREPO|nr:hypothetical protein DPMN_027281 [Dreissena polymorpha]